MAEREGPSMKLQIKTQTRALLAARVGYATDAALSISCALMMADSSGAPGVYLWKDEHLRLLRSAALTLIAETGPSQELCDLASALPPVGPGDPGS